MDLQLPGGEPVSGAGIPAATQPPFCAAAGAAGGLSPAQAEQRELRQIFRRNTTSTPPAGAPNELRNDCGNAPAAVTGSRSQQVPRRVGLAE